MRKSMILVAAMAGMVSLTAASCGPAPDPGPNPACAPAANALASASQALGLAKGAFAVARVFITNPTVLLAITTALDSASAGIAKAQASIGVGKCDIASYIDAAVEAIKVALAKIAENRPAMALQPGAGPDPLSTMLNDSGSLADQAKAAAH